MVSGRSSAVVRTIRPIKNGEEILDNYGYHYAVMEKEDRQKTLSGQYFFVCQCSACLDNWPTYPSIPTSLEVLPGCDEKATVRKHQMLSKNYKKAFDDVLQGRYGGALPILIEYLNFLDQVKILKTRLSPKMFKIWNCYSRIFKGLFVITTSVKKPSNNVLAPWLTFIFLLCIKNKINQVLLHIY